MKVQDQSKLSVHAYIKYRPDIDGLRAIAVLSVILYHAGFKWFSGGFVGVDVFFVISGYLITGIILSDLRKGNFSLMRFYERRARRILPALFFIMALSLPFAYWLMMPDQFFDFSKSLIFIPLFLSNIYFWFANGYFDPSMEEKPLIHTWSLGVEEQYYLFFPLMILLLYRFDLKVLMSVVTGLALISFGISEFGALYHPSGAFFLTPSRAWELLLGALISFFAFYNRHCYEYVTHRLNQFFAILGLLLIIVPVFIYNPDISFPGIHAFFPCIGTVFLLAFSGPKTLVNKILSQKILVWLGLISYSAYLWHQPLFAFMRIYYIDQPSQYVFMFLSMLSIILAYVSWRFIEKPFRDNRKYITRQILVLSLVGTIFLMGFGIMGYMTHGLFKKYSVNQQMLWSVEKVDYFKHQRKVCLLEADQGEGDFSGCTLEKPMGIGKVFLWGDSFATHLYSGLKSKTNFNKLIYLTSSACPPIIDYDFSHIGDQRPFCRAINDYILERIKKEKPDKVILAANWNLRVDKWIFVERTILKLQAFGIKEIVLVGPMPRWTSPLPRILTRFDRPFDELPMRLKSYYNNEDRVVDIKMQDLANKLNVRYISLTKILCNGTGCLVRVGPQPNQMLNFDEGHLTYAGSKYVVSHFPTFFFEIG